MNVENAHMAEIMIAIGQGDKKAFEQLFRIWYVRLCIYAESLIHDRDQAEDLVQNVFYLLWEKRLEIDIRESVKSYLYRSVYNAALNILKHEKVKLAFLDFIRKHENEEEDDSEYFFNKENREFIFREINRAIETLPEQCKEIFILSRFVGKKSIEIAQDMDISVRTVETQLYRAMKRLRQELEHLKNSGIFFFILLKDC